MDGSYVKAFVDWLERFHKLSDAEFGRLVRAALEYKKNGTVVQLSGREELLLDGIRLDIDRDEKQYQDICEARAAAGRKGAEVRWGDGNCHFANSKNSKSHFANGKNGQDKRLKIKDQRLKIKDYISSSLQSEDIAQVMQAWDKACGISSPAECEIIADLLDSYGKDNMLYAIQQAVEHKAPTVAYIRAVLTKPKRTSDDEARRNFEEWLNDEQD